MLFLLLKERIMKISYKKLFKLMIDKDIIKNNPGGNSNGGKS